MTPRTLIADSGSTKTTWMEVTSGNMIVTEGLNPHFTSDEQFLKAFNNVGVQLGTVNRVVFYGAGCGDEQQKHRTVALLCKGFHTDNVMVETDMLGACRAVAGGQSAIVGILGTGSNACYYDGIRITHNSISTGFILGDKGSANHVGRLLLNDYLTHAMPNDISTIFHDTYPMTNSQFMDAVYHQPHPNRFLASLAPFAVHHIKHNYCCEVITSSIKGWYEEMVKTLRQEVGTEHTLHLIGSYAQAIEPMLRTLMNNYGITVGNIIADPIEGLRQYHIHPTQK